MKIVTMKVKFYGLYYWGSGWKDAETMRKWTEFWNSKDGSGIFWTHFTKKDVCGDINYLVSTGGSCYLHPMDHEVMYRSYGSAYSFGDGGEKIKHYPEIEEMIEICNKCAEYCGGEVEYSEVKEFEC